jgi:hypothetical protein
MRRFIVAAAALLCLAAAPPLTPEQQAVISHISADSLRGHLSFIASDLLEGRDTPSRGLDTAAEYIAAQFRRAGLEPAGPSGADEYFQTATLTVREPNYEGFEMTVSASGKTLRIAANEISLLLNGPLAVDNAPLVVLDGSTRPLPEQVDGKVVLITSQRGAPGIGQTRPALTITLGREPSSPARSNSAQVFDPEGRPQRNRAVIVKPELAAFVKNARDPRVTIRAAASREHPVTARNVAAILRGSDPKLRSTFVMLTSHYDHLGIRDDSANSGSAARPAGDRIFNGANDDGSGTVSVMEIASAVAALPKHPARSILFVTFFGEEHGLMGSAYYSRHPLVPLVDTVADLNLEQLGRTDSGTGPLTTNVSKTASITGYDFSDLPKILATAAEAAGVRVYKDSKASDPYFEDSDNLSLALVGIPAHTLCVAFQFPDYHKVGDHWDKIDYTNMATVDRAVALGLLRLASDAPPPKWNEYSGPARRYVEAAKRLHP